MALDTTKTAHELVNSGRSTGQTVIDSDGNLKWAIHNIVTTDLNNAAEWTPFNLSVVVEAGVNANGKKRYLLTEDTTAGVSHYLNRPTDVTAGEIYTIAAIVKPNGRYAVISLGSAFGSDQWSFDLDTLAVARLSGTNTTSTATATALTDGEVLIEFTATASSTGGVAVQFRLWDGGAGDTGYDGDGTSGLYVSEAKVYQSAIKGRAQLITNGTFTSDVSGWSSENGLLTWNAAGYADFDRNSEPFGNHLYQSISTIIGKTYRVAYEIVAVSNTVDLRIGNITRDQVTSTGQKFYTFTATGTTTEIEFNVSGDVAGTFSIDNISALEMTDAMQRDKFGSNFLENETGAALYGLGIDYSTGRGGLQVYEGRANLLLNTASLSTQNVTVTATPHTLSFTGTGTVTLSGASTAGPLVGTGAADTDRVSLTFTPSAGTLTLTVSGSVTFAQLEAGSSAFPYIPTYGSTVTRGKDELSTLVSSFGYNVNAGTVVAEFATPGTDGTNFPRVWQLSTSVDNTTRVAVVASPTVSANVTDNLVQQAGLVLNPLVPYAQSTVAMSFAPDDFAASQDGDAAVVDTTGTLPATFTQLMYGKAFQGDYLNGLIYSLAYYPFAASDEQLVEASS